MASMMKLAAASALFALTAAQSGYINYTTVTGYFLQDLAATNASIFDYTAVNFGLINQTYSGVSTSSLTQWQQFEQVVESLNENSALDTVYKVFFFGRHGEGYHNAAETFYGTPAWNCYWSILNGNSTASWEDADLTANGIKQALIANAFWKQELATQKIPYPQSYYTSPLTRCLRTANLTFSDIQTPEYYPFIPEVKEFFREGISEHTCDRRSNKTHIHNRFPTYTFEAGFTESDELWNANLAETSPAQDIRSKAALDSVFQQDDHTWISVTSHSGEIGSLLRVLGHRTFSLSTGAVIPVLVKAQFLPAAPSDTALSGPARTFSAYCTNGPPVTSIATAAQGCVCSGTASSGIASATGKSSSGGNASASSSHATASVTSRTSIASSSSSHAAVSSNTSRSVSGTVHGTTVPVASISLSTTTSKPRYCKSRSTSSSGAVSKTLSSHAAGSSVTSRSSSTSASHTSSTATSAVSPGKSSSSSHTTAKSAISPAPSSSSTYTTATSAVSHATSSSSHTTTATSAVSHATSSSSHTTGSSAVTSPTSATSSITSVPLQSILKSSSTSKGKYCKSRSSATASITSVPVQSILKSSSTSKGKYCKSRSLSSY